MQLNNVFSDWLTANKISKETQKTFGLDFDENIIIPVHDLDGQFSFNKYRRSPLSDDKPKYWYDKGGRIKLYGWFQAKDSETILITEGEKDCLVAWSHNIPAITSTGGAMSFQEEWAELLEDKEVILCFDNDESGAEGMVRALEYVPHAKVLIIPDETGIKDISDYVMRGGDINELIKTAQHFDSITEVRDDMKKRMAIFKNYRFHVAYMKKHTKKPPADVKKQTYSSDSVTHAKNYPMTDLLEFKQNKARCPYHNEKTPSFTYFPKTNTCYCFGCNKVADSIDLYQKLNNCSFKEAVEKLQ